MSEPMKLRARVQAPLEQVRHALTDAAQLRVWLAEHAEVDLPHTYAFWGRYTPEGDAPHQRPLHVDDRTIELGWLIDGQDTTVRIALADEGDATVIELEQSHFPGWQVAVEESNIRGTLHTFWSLSLANLIDHLEGRALTPKTDFTSSVMREEILIDAAPSRVFDALVDGEKFSRWFGAEVAIDPELGGRWAMGGFEADEEPAKIVDFAQDKKISVMFPGCQVSSWELEESGGRTRLTFVNSGFDEDRPPYGEWMGWLAGLAELRRFLELDRWRPVWVEVGVPE